MATNEHDATASGVSRGTPPDAEHLTVEDLIQSDGLVEPQGAHDRDDGSATMGERITSDRLPGGESREHEHPVHHVHETTSDATLINADRLPDGRDHGHEGEESETVAERIVSDDLPRP